MDGQSVKKGPRLSTEIRGVPDKKVYNKNYGFPYRVIRWCCIPGIVYYIIGLILSRAFDILIPGVSNEITAWIIGVWITGSIVGIPASYIVAHISFKRIKNDYLVFKKNSFLWHKESIREKVKDEDIHRDDEYTVLEISNKSQETRGYFKIHGIIEHVGIRSGKRLKPMKVTRITIPKAFTHMDEIYKYPIVEEQVQIHRMRQEALRKKEEKARKEQITKTDKENSEEIIKEIQNG